MLVLGNQVVHVALDLVELHLVQAFAGAPVEESLPPEHGGELLRDALEQFLDGGAVADEGNGCLESARRDVAHCNLDVVKGTFQALAGVPVEESLPPEHGCELLRDALEQFLDGGAVVTDICETGGPMLRKRTEEEEMTVGV